MSDVVRGACETPSRTGKVHATPVKQTPTPLCKCRGQTSRWGLVRGLAAAEG